MEQANQLTYKNPRVNCRTVTLSGEDYNPRGVLTGGSRNTKASVLQALYNMSEQYEQLDMINQRLQIIRGNITCL
jgi:chromosome segregation ATPase